MADVKISGYTPIAGVMGLTDIIEVSEGGTVSKSATGANIVDMVGADNLAAVVDPGVARTNLELSGLAIKNKVNDDDWLGADLSIANGGTGASTAPAALAAIGAEAAFGKNTGFNLNLGTSASTVSEGNHLHGGVYEPADGTILKNADIGVNIEAFVSKLTGWNKNFGTIAGTVSEGDHDHDLDYEPLDNSILKDADIGVSVMAHDATMLVDADIGSSVQAHSAVLDATTAAFLIADQTNLGNQSGTNTGDNAVNSLYSGLNTNVTTNLSFGRTATTVTVQSSDGTNAILPIPTGSFAGIMSSAMWGKVNGIATGADVTATNETSHADVLVDGDIGVNVEAYDATILKDADIGVTVQAAGSYETADGTILKDADIGVNVQAHSSVLDATTASFLIADESKLDGLVSNVTTDLGYVAGTRTITSSDGANVVLPEAVAGGNSGLLSGSDLTRLNGMETGAEVTSAAKVNSAGAIMESDVSGTPAGVIIDDDTMATASNTTIATSESVKAYVDAQVASGTSYVGGFDPTGVGTPNLNTITSTKGEMYTVTTAGTYNFTTGTDPILEIGDVLLAEADGVLSDAGSWTIVQANLDAAGIKASYESNSNTNVYPDADVTKMGHITVTGAADLDDIAGNTTKISNVTTNLSYTAATRSMNSSDGTNAIIPLVVAAGNAGLMSGADKTTLDAVSGSNTGDNAVNSLYSGLVSNVTTNISWTAGTTAGPICNSSDGSDAAIPSASASASGAVTTGAQTFAGVKTFNSTISGDIDGTAAIATRLDIATVVDTDTTMFPLLAGSNTIGNKAIKLDGLNYSYDASTNILTAGGFAGSGASLTSLNANNISSGTISTSYVDNLSGTNTGDNAVNSNYSGLVSNVTTNLTFGRTSTTVTVQSSDGTNAILPVPTASLAGIMTAAHWTKLNGIATSADVTSANTCDSPNVVQTTITGNAGTATAWQTGRTITLTGDVTGVSGSWNGSGNISFATVVGNNSHTHDDSTINSLNASAITLGTLAVARGGTGTTTSTGSGATMRGTTPTMSNPIVTGSMDLAYSANLYFDGGSNTYIQSNTADNLRIVCGATERFNANGSGIQVVSAITATGNITAYSSDLRLKKAKLITSAMDAINKWEPIEYTWNQLAKGLNEVFRHNTVEFGLSAQSVQATHPSLTPLAPFDTDDDGNSISGENYLTIDYERTTGVIVAGMQEQDAIIKAQAAEIKSLKDDLTAIKTYLKM